jgi:hypothetical protein
MRRRPERAVKDGREQLSGRDDRVPLPPDGAGRVQLTHSQISPFLVR